MTDLASIYVTSGVNEHGQGFLTVAAHGQDGTILVGQLSPAQVRDQALAWLSAAEGADQDAAVVRVVRNLGVDPAFAMAVVTELRQQREGE